MLGNAVPSLIAEVLAREIRRQLLDAPIRKQLKLLPPLRENVPAPVKVAPVPRKYHEHIGVHDAHPGTGKGREALKRAAQNEAAASQLVT
jgi:DNA (cytosine-5)-methyltransferase 1